MMAGADPESLSFPDEEGLESSVGNNIRKSLGIDEACYGMRAIDTDLFLRHTHKSTALIELIGARSICIEIEAVSSGECTL